jgi:hypothetical protein
MILHVATLPYVKCFILVEKSNQLREGLATSCFYLIINQSAVCPNRKKLVIVAMVYSSPFPIVPILLMLTIVKISKYRESYMPKMFATAVFDVINGLVKNIRENPTLDEISDAEDMLNYLEKNSLCIYDRLFIVNRRCHVDDLSLNSSSIHDFIQILKNIYKTMSNLWVIEILLKACFLTESSSLALW